MITTQSSCCSPVFVSRQWQSTNVQRPILAGLNHADRFRSVSIIVSMAMPTTVCTSVPCGRRRGQLWVTNRSSMRRGTHRNEPMDLRVARIGTQPHWCCCGQSKLANRVIPCTLRCCLLVPFLCHMQVLDRKLRSRCAIRCGVRCLRLTQPDELFPGSLWAAAVVDALHNTWSELLLKYLLQCRQVQLHLQLYGQDTGTKHHDMLVRAAC